MHKFEFSRLDWNVKGSIHKRVNIKYLDYECFEEFIAKATSNG